MSLNKKILIASLQKNLPNEVVENLVSEYIHIKQQFLLRKWRPTELNCGRFGECVLRVIEHVTKSTYTPFGAKLESEKIIRDAANNGNLSETFQLLIPRLTRVILDFRNKRDVAHVGGEVDPNEQDSLLVVHSSDWIMAEIVRKFHNTNLTEAAKLVKSILEFRIPILNEFDGFVKILDINLDTTEKTLCLIYYKQPEKVSESDLFLWSGYGNIANYKSKILKKLDSQALIHYKDGKCELTSKGILFIEKNIDLNKVLT
jgi:hypothetical protein